MQTKIEKILLYAFSTFLSLGIFNPFNPTAIFEEESTGFTPVQVIAVLYVLFSLFNKDNYRYIVKYWKHLLPLIVLFFLLSIAALTYGYTVYMDNSLFNYKLVISILFYFFVLIAFTRDTKLRFNNLVIFALGTALIGGFYILGFLEPFVFMSKGRLFLFGENPNSSSTRMAISGLIWLYIVLENPYLWRKQRYFLFIGICISVWFILVSGSRGSLIAFILFAAFMFIRSKVKKKIKIFSFVFLSMLAVYVYTLAISSGELSIVERMNSTIADGDTGERVHIWRDVIEIANNNIIIGVGENGYINEMNKRFGYYLDPHNIFLYIFVCGGFFALIAFIVFIGKLISDLYKTLHSSSFPFALFLLVLFVSAKTGGVLTYIVMWYFFGIAKSYSLEKKITKLV